MSGTFLSPRALNLKQQLRFQRIRGVAGIRMLACSVQKAYLDHRSSKCKLDVLSCEGE